VGFFREVSAEQEAAELAESRAWRALLFDHGFGWLTGPPEFGGRDLPMAYEQRFRRLAADFDTPDEVSFSLGLGMVAPTILRHGTAATKERYLRAIHRGDVIACQLFSEPGAGSDLASLTTRADPDGDVWRITGQKVWTSRAQFADIGLCLARTGPPGSRHRGLTCFVVDMRAPGVTVRPLRQMTGGASFNEVFLDDVRVDDDHRVGGVDDGWTTAITTLMNERQRIGGGGGGVPEIDLPRLIALVRHQHLAEDAVTRDRLARLIAQDRTATWTAARGQANAAGGREPGPEMSAAKLLRTHTAVEMAEFVASTLGAAITADSGAWGTYAWSQLLLGQPGVRIGGGTDEILRNVLAERILGLPR
jgi:alkylation response protein AidB-like acyl-CoA dehydrogenase